MNDDWTAAPSPEEVPQQEAEDALARRLAPQPASAEGSDEATPEASPEPEVEPWRGIVVRGEGRRFFVPTASLLGIEKDLEVYPFPLGPPWLVGVARWRRGPVAVARLTNLSEGAAGGGRDQRLLVLAGATGEPLGVLVEGVEGSRAVPPTPRPPAEVGLDDLPRHLVEQAVSNDDEEWLPVLDGVTLEKYLNTQADAP